MGNLCNDCNKNAKILEESKYDDIRLEKSLPTFECQICGEIYSAREVIKLSCNHKLHRKCFVQYFQSQVEIKKLSVKCFEADCPTEISVEEIQKNIPQNLQTKYYDFSFHELVDENKQLNWCLTAGCEAVFEVDGDVDQYKCPVCKKQYCLMCQTEAHNGLTCQQNKKNAKLPEQQRQFINFARGAHYKQCPSCKYWVQKKSGCDHMTCRCKYQFCFRCGGQYGQCNCDDASSYFGGNSSQISDLYPIIEQLGIQDSFESAVVSIDSNIEQRSNQRSYTHSMGYNSSNLSQVTLQN